MNHQKERVTLENLGHGAASEIMDRKAPGVPVIG